MGDDEMDEGPSARERRAQRVREQSRRDMPKRAGKILAIVLVVVLLVAGIVWAYNAFKPPKEIHHHVGFLMFNDGQKVDFDNRAFDLGATEYLRAHLHVPSDPDYILHVEGLPGVSLARFFESVQMQTSDDRVSLHPVIHGGVTLQNNQTHEWQVWVDVCADGPDNWRAESAMFGYVPGQHDRVLMTFTARGTTIDQLSSQTAMVPTDQDIETNQRDTCDGSAPVGQPMPGIVLDDDRRIARPW